MIYCYNDRESVGAEVAAWVKKYKGSSQLITHPAQVEGGEGVKVFAYPAKGGEGDYILAMMEEIAKRFPGIEFVPDLRVMRLNGRIVNQAMVFGQWMPSGWLYQSMDEVRAGINDMVYPLYSMSNSGDRRAIESPSDAYVDATECFKGKGILLESGKIQKDYSYFQTELRQPANCWRVFMFRKRYAVIVMIPSKNGPNVMPMDVISEQLAELLKYVTAFVMDNGFDWGSVEVLAGSDIVREVRSPFVMSISTGWPQEWLKQGGMIFESKDKGFTWESTGIPAVRWYQIVAKELVGNV